MSAAAQARALPLAGEIRASADIQAAFALFNQVSTELSDSYRLLERRVEQLSSELEQVDRARLRELEQKERVSERLQSLLDLLPGGVVVLDPGGVVCDCNPAAREMLGATLPGERWIDVIRRCFAPRSDDGHEISLRSGRRVSVATRSLERGMGQLVLLTDLTETRELQDRLSRHRRLTAMGRMMAALAHQLRTPLAAAMLYASNLRDAELTPEQTRRFSTKVLSRLAHLERQVRDMLIYVRGDLVLDELCSVREILDDLGAALEAPATSAGVRCAVALGCDPGLRLRCNREVLGGALMNLVTNALEAGGAGGRIDVEAALEDGRLSIAVRDDGPGMSAGMAALAGEDFFTTKAQGTGLGLAVVRAVARAHGGEFRIASAPGEGTRASVLLPLAAAAGSDAGVVDA
ncbi:MAG: Signal transduction histidine-protein kinase AtoS [Pseudomonadales bacterium]|nr:Signal transduction histidine-protein kinase AtoS [Pseudomonadales bacterium]